MIYNWKKKEMNQRNLFDTNEALRKWDRSETRIEIVQSFVRIDTKEISNVDVIGQRRREAQDSNHTLWWFHLSNNQIIWPIQLASIKKLNSTLKIKW